MSSPFAAAMKVAAATCDSVMGETFTFLPMKRTDDVDARAAADADRAIVEHVLGVWGEPTARVSSAAARQPGVKPEYPGHASARPFVSLDLVRLPWLPRKGDRVVREETGDLYVIAERLPSAPGYARFDLNEIREPQ